MKLPELPIKIPKRDFQVYNIMGVNRSDDFSAGTLSDCKNISSLRFPYISTRKERSNVNTDENVTAITAWDELLEVDGTRLLYGGVERGEVTEGAKQFAVVNTKIVVFPDKKYLDLKTLSLVDMVNEISMSGTITVNQVSDTVQTLTVAGKYEDYSPLFAPYKPENGRKRETVVLKLTANDVETEYQLQYVGISDSSGSLVISFRNDKVIAANTYSAAIMYRDIPDFDYVCSFDNRVFGCISEKQSIYVSALGEPQTYYYIEPSDNSASKVIPVGTPGKFTGCAALGSSVIFFKEKCIHKILPSGNTYVLYTYDMEGVKEGCYKSVQVINDAIFYLSHRGVMVYSGSTATKISDELGDEPLYEGVAGNDGVRYYLCCRDSIDYKLFTFDLKKKVWLIEEHDKIVDFTRLGDTVHMVKDGKLYAFSSLPLTDDWYIQFNDICEYNYNNYGNRTGVVLNKKFYSRLVLKLEVSEYAVVKVRFDGGRWIDTGKITKHKEGVFTHVVPINRCDKFGIRIEGHGEFVLHAMQREYIGESYRNE